MKSFILFLALSSPLFARIGETREQCIQRYGQIIEEDSGALPSTYFKKGDFEIRIDFHEGKAESICYTKKIKNDKGAFDYQSISAPERDALLKINGPDKKWSSEYNKDYTNYRTSDDSLTAIYFDDMKEFKITTVEGRKRKSNILKEIEKMKIDKKIEGL